MVCGAYVLHIPFFRYLPIWLGRQKSCGKLVGHASSVTPSWNVRLKLPLRVHRQQKTGSLAAACSKIREFLFVPGYTAGGTTTGVPTPFGFGPYLLSPGWLSVHISTSSQMPPTSGIREMNSHQPLFPRSCSLLTPTARLGMITARA